MARLLRLPSVLARAALLAFVLISLDTSDAQRPTSTCQAGPSDTICTEQILCDGTSTCCYPTGVCVTTNQAICINADPLNTLFPPPYGDNLVNSASSAGDGCVCVGNDAEFNNPALACASSVDSGTPAAGCWGTVRCDGVGTCKDTGYCISGNNGAFLGTICVQAGSGGEFKYCGVAGFVPPTRQPTTVPTQTPTTASPTASPSVNGDTRAPTPVPVPTPAPTTARPTTVPTRSPTAAPTFSGPCLRLRPGGGPFDQGREIHSRTHKAKKTATIKKTTTIKALNDLRERLLATPIFDGESQEQPENDRSLTGLKSASGTGKNLRVTQVIKSSWNQTMAGVIWSFRLPDYATYGTVKTQPAYLTTSDQISLEKAQSGEIPGQKGQQVISRMAGRGTLTLFNSQNLLWNIGEVYPKKTYKISFTIKLIAFPPPGTDFLVVDGSFLAALVDDSDGSFVIVDCDDQRELPL